MTLKKISSPAPKYLAATDILIGDMSDINYEFLIFDRPIILLANKWLRDNFPEIGIKTNLTALEEAIEKSIDDPDEYSDKRKYWLQKTMLKPDGNSSKRVIDAIMNISKIRNPIFFLIHGNNEVIKTHLDPLYSELLKNEKEVHYIDFFNEEKYALEENFIIISANNIFIEDIIGGFKTHIDHGVKGLGTTDMNGLIKQYKEKDYFPNVDLHITEGEVSYEKTKKCLDPLGERTLMVGYPKSDTLLELKNRGVKLLVCKELGLDPDKILITYAPAGKYSYPFKQGASLSNNVIKKLKKIAKQNDKINILIKLKSPQPSLFKRIFNKILRSIN